MQPDLSRTRRTLTLRYAVFCFVLLFIFAATVYGQVSYSRRQMLCLQLKQLASTAAAELPLIHHEYDEMRQPARRVHPNVPLIAHFDEQLTSEGYKRIRWFDPDLRELSAYGTFRPAGPTVPEPARRQFSQILPLSNGLAIWQPVRLRQAPGQAPVLNGYVSVAMGSMASNQELDRLRQGLVIGSLLAGLAAFAGSQWMVGVSLRPIRRQIEQLVRFTADASHELRHPITAIRAVIGSLQHGEALAGAQPVVLEKLALIDGASERMGKLVDDLLLLTRFDRAITDHSGWRDFPLEELVEDQCRLFQDSANGQGVSLIAELQDEATVYGHPERLRRLLVNLISNALRFSASGDTVLVGLKVQGAYVQLWVDDQGPGIPQAQREQVFQRFWQADPARSSSHGGLGLAIARAIAQAHGGRLVAREAPSGGARLLLELPLKG